MCFLEVIKQPDYCHSDLEVIFKNNYSCTLETKLRSFQNKLNFRARATKLADSELWTFFNSSTENNFGSKKLIGNCRIRPEISQKFLSTLGPKSPTRFTTLNLPRTLAR